MVFRCPNIQAHYNEPVVCLNFGTPENNEFSIWDKWKIYYFWVSQYLSTLGYFGHGRVECSKVNGYIFRISNSVIFILYRILKWINSYRKKCPSRKLCRETLCCVKGTRFYVRETLCSSKRQKTLFSAGTHCSL